MKLIYQRKSDEKENLGKRVVILCIKRMRFKFKISGFLTKLKHTCNPLKGIKTKYHNESYFLRGRLFIPTMKAAKL